MKLNYTVNSIRISSEWFDDMGRKSNVYQKITYKGLNLYFQLYKFRLHNQENEHTFITSISMLRRETGYKSEEIFELLKKLKSAKVIELHNVSRWDYLIDDTGSIKDKDILIIAAKEAFSLTKFEKESQFYIYIPLDLFTLYKEKGLNEKYYSLYCLIKKWSNNTEDKMWMSISKMSDRLGFDKDYVNQMIYQMNRNYFLSSYRKKKKEKLGYSFEHHILDSGKKDKIEKFIESHQDNMDKLINRVDKKRKNKKAADIEDEMEIVEVEEVQPVEMKLAFGTKRAQIIGEPDPFDDLDEELFG